MTAILSQYLMRTILTSTAMVLVVLLALAGLFEFIAELDDTQAGYQTPQVILFAALRLPNLAFEMLPVAALIGSLLGLGALAGNSEIIVMRSAGLSVTRLSGMVAVSGLVMLVITGLVGEFIGPPLDLYARDMRMEARYEKGDARLGTETWVKDGPVYLHLERINTEFEFGSIYLFRFNDNDALASIAKAENSGIDEDDNWVLENLRETRFENDAVQIVESPVAVESFEVNAELLGSSLAKPLSLSARGLLVYIDYLKRNNLDASQYESELWFRASRTLTVLIMPILALAFVFGSLRTGGAGGRLMLGVIVGLAYYLASETLANSGQVFNLNPALVNWLPSLVLCLITVGALLRIR
ncbi:MAG: LPS export ABC transporter permease LptG [Gammaproteobacteria bacterium]|nr:LPS export ABC transporter permease LptG [Gammaproteobacteria bacterium]MBU2676944.1 LPS export ABC transporter permease LptG [Gammaproteobacteria bacterium]NNL50677.1 LPS export ABC transporter permease LptG [Woeseiaceae bacterium]